MARRPIQLPVLVGTQCHLIRGRVRVRGRGRGRGRGRSKGRGKGRGKGKGRARARARGKARVLPASGRPQHRYAGRRRAVAYRVA